MILVLMLQIHCFCYWYWYWYCNVGSSNIDIDIEIQFPLSHSPEAHWIYQNSILMSWPETTEHANVLLMTQGFRNDLSFLSPPQQIFFALKSPEMKGNMILSKTKFCPQNGQDLGSGTKRKVISESLGHKENVGVLRCFRSWH